MPGFICSNYCSSFCGETLVPDFFRNNFFLQVAVTATKVAHIAELSIYWVFPSSVNGVSCLARLLISYRFSNSMLVMLDVLKLPVDSRLLTLISGNIRGLPFCFCG